MSSSDVQIKIIGKDEASNSFRKVREEAEKVATSMANVSNSASTMKNIFTGTMSAMLGFAGIEGITSSLNSSIEAAKEFYTTMETGSISMAGTLVSMTTINGQTFAGRYIQVRILPKSIDGIGNIVIKGVTVTIDVPDMEDIIENVRLNAAAATTIHFNKKFKEIKSFSAYTDLAGRQVTCVLENRTESSIDVSALDDNGNRIAATLQKLVIRGY